MKKITLLFLTTVSVLLLQAQTQQFGLTDTARLNQWKSKIVKGDTAALRLLKYFQKEADLLLPMKPGSVMEKNFLPPSKDRHDYMSLAPYFWPDLSKPDSLPYIRKDGQRNPMIDKISDKKNLVDLGRNTQILALAWWLTGDKKYAQKAAEFLRTWFVNPETRMNPNLTYAQAVLGVNDGRGIGIIETVNLANATDAVLMLRKSGVLTTEEQNIIRKWYSDYLQWMLTSKNGTDERHALNNHGIWYDMQVLAFSLFLGKTDFAKQYTDTTLARIKTQIEPDGRMPLELERTTALGYNTFCLEAWFKTAFIARRIGVHILDYTTPDGRGLKKALDWLLPYALGDKPWTYQQIKDYSERDKLPFLLLEAERNYKNPAYREARIRLSHKDTELTELLFGE
jgi:hypothetical protein